MKKQMFVFKGAPPKLKGIMSPHGLPNTLPISTEDTQKLFALH